MTDKTEPISAESVPDTADAWWNVVENGENIALTDETTARRIVAALRAEAEARATVPTPGVTELPMLTDTEEHILAMSATGLSCQEIAHLRGTSAQTVKNHRAHIRQKLGVPSMTHAYIQRGWLIPPRHSTEAPGPAGTHDD